MTAAARPDNYQEFGKNSSSSSIDTDIPEPKVRNFFPRLLIGCLATAVAFASATVGAQTRIAFPPGTVANGTSAPLVPVQPYGPAMPPAYGAPQAPVLGTPTFDPYSSANTAPTLFGNPAAAPYGPTPQGAPSFGSLFGQPAQQPVYGTPVLQPAPTAGVPYGAAPPAYPAYPGAATANPYPGQNPNALFPNGINWGPYTDQTGNPAEPLRLFDNLRIRDIWLMGGNGRNMSINDTEIATTLQVPNFLWTQQILRVSPNFGMHLWSGPQNPPTNADMPPRAYSAFVEFGLRSDPAQTFGGDVTASIGIFSDFNAITTNSIRVQGIGFGFVRLTPQFMFKIGVEYLDRVEVKILPAIGFYWEPNPQTRLDFFFPKPKLSHYLTTLGNTDFWVYLAGEYGGGSWTIDHPNGAADQVDINDIRIMLGIDWTAQSGIKGMFEVGYVTDRQLRYRSAVNEDTHLLDTIMLRAGILW